MQHLHAIAVHASHLKRARGCLAEEARLYETDLLRQSNRLIQAIL